MQKNARFVYRIEFFYKNFFEIFIVFANVLFVTPILGHN